MYMQLTSDQIPTRTCNYILLGKSRAGPGCSEGQRGFRWKILGMSESMINALAGSMRLSIS